MSTIRHQALVEDAFMPACSAKTTDGPDSRGSRATNSKRMPVRQPLADAHRGAIGATLVVIASVALMKLLSRD